MPRKKHLINVHTSTGTTAPTNASLYLGEIAVQHTPNDPALWIKVGSDETSTDYEKFIGETEIIDLIDNSEIILGSGYTYSGLPYVNSATTVTAAYSALTREVCDNEVVIAAALNTLNNKIIELSGNTSGSTDIEPLSASVISLSAAVKDNEYVAAAALNYLNDRIDELSGNTGGGGGDIQPLSSATYSHITNNDVHVTASDKTNWTNGANSGASAYTAVTELSAATTAHSTDTTIHVPTNGTNGQYLSLVNGSPSWVTPITIYTGTNPPDHNLGNNGDIYLQTP